jgi:type I restriction enzyme S subunit
MLPHFSKYYFRSRIHRDFFTAEMNLVTRASLGQDLLKQMPVLLPPKDEQKAICSYLDKETGIIEETIGRETRGIQYMLEYHTRLIADVVTGAVDVREAAKAIEEVVHVEDAMDEARELETEVEEELDTSE